MATQSTEEALDLLRSTRSHFIAESRRIALLLIEEHGVTNSREVFDRMTSEGLIDASVKNYWLGVTFRSKDFEWTGDWKLPPVPEGVGNCHEWRPVKVWRKRS